VATTFLHIFHFPLDQAHHSCSKRSQMQLVAASTELHDAYTSRVCRCKKECDVLAALPMPVDIVGSVEPSCHPQRLSKKKDTYRLLACAFSVHRSAKQPLSYAILTGVLQDRWCIYHATCQRLAHLHCEKHCQPTALPRVCSIVKYWSKQASAKHWAPHGSAPRKAADTLAGRP
jgi:hypothetical protein